MQPAEGHIDHKVAVWLFAGCAMVAVILIVGGLTRLNQAGLSITEWEVVGGVIPPVGETQWQAAFERYRQFPEYQQLNKGMGLAAFKHIYWWEYTHRMLARGLGLLFVIPFAVFLLRRKIDLALAARLLGVFALGGLQGLLGWYMVQSGLMGEPYVSHLRLALHLGLAVLIFGLLFRVALSAWYGKAVHAGLTVLPLVRKAAWVLVALVFVQILYGGLVAGLKAGFVYNSFPKMGAYWIPPEIGLIAPWWSDMVNNPATVQLIHRVLALALSVMALGLWAVVRRGGPAGELARASHMLLALIAVQVAVGVGLLLAYVPVWLSAIHQILALAVFAAALWVEKLLQMSPGVQRAGQPLVYEPTQNFINPQRVE